MYVAHQKIGTFIASSAQPLHLAGQPPKKANNHSDIPPSVSFFCRFAAISSSICHFEGGRVYRQQPVHEKKLKVSEAMEAKKLVLHLQSLPVDATILHQITGQMGSFR